RSASRAEASANANLASSPRLAAPGEAQKTSDAEPARGGLPVASYVLGGVGVAALGVFAYLGLRAKRDSDAMRDGCAPACAHDDVTALKTKLVAADVALGVGALGLGAATFFALRGPRTGPTVTWDFR